MQIHNFFSKKDIRKLIRTIFQTVVLVVLAYIIVTALVTLERYEPYDLAIAEDKDKGFIAISYFGVDRIGDHTLVSTKRLEEHLKALKASGYVTITQQDVIDYYKKKKALPEKSLFLMFEDGRRDTAIFSQKIMEKYNYIGTMLTYADKFEKKDMKFLMPEDLLALEDSTFWELGTNGYRLSYINVFDRHKNYLGELDSLEFSETYSYLDRNYNHYLMDYIRDGYGIPKESYEEMKERISWDYKKIEETYTQVIGRVPKLYILMHSNTGQYGTNDKVSAINEKWMQQLFKIHFNREGYSLNTKESSIYDLTRIQPQAYWPTNHLLMRIGNDTQQEVTFVTGDLDKAKKWEEIEGQAEFVEDVITLTSMPKGKGRLRLIQRENYEDFKLSVYLEGNKLGSQAIYVRADETLENYILIQIKDNILDVYEKLEGNEKRLFSLDLDEHDGIKRQLAYKPVLEMRESSSRQLEVSITGNSLDILIDKKEAVSHLRTSNVLGGCIYLESAWSKEGYSQRNLADDIYDGIFKSLVITTEEGKETKVIFDNRLHGWDYFIYAIKKVWESIINWFIRTL